MAQLTRIDTESGMSTQCSQHTLASKIAIDREYFDINRAMTVDSHRGANIQHVPSTSLEEA